MAWRRAAQSARSQSVFAGRLPWGRSAYPAGAADRRARRWALRPKPCVLALNDRLQAPVTGKLQQDWCPEQISAWLKMQFPDDATMHVSHETIYRTLFVQARGALKKAAPWAPAWQAPDPPLAYGASDGRGQIADAISIRERPVEAQDRAIPGSLGRGSAIPTAPGSAARTKIPTGYYGNTSLKGPTCLATPSTAG